MRYTDGMIVLQIVLAVIAAIIACVLLPYLALQQPLVFILVLAVFLFFFFRRFSDKRKVQ